jgi:peroxiredoxin
MQLKTYPRTSLEASSGRSHHIKRGQHDQTVLGRAAKQHLRLGLLLMAIGILLTTTATAQPRRNDRTGNSENRLKAMMERFDTNRDGVVTKDEFKGSSERFSMMDHNGDGKVDGAEMTAMRNRMQRSNRQGGNRRGPDGFTQRHGTDKSPKVGQKVPDFTLQLLHSEKTVTLSEAYRDKPVVLTLGSYTCPPYRNALEGINDLSQQYDDEFAFYFVYIKEAHATDERPTRGNERIGIEFKQPTTYLERELIAKTCQQQIELTMPILVDTLDNAVEKLFAGAPNRTYLIDQNGIVLYKGVRGPQGSRPDDVSKAIQKQLRLKNGTRLSADQTDIRGSEKGRLLKP